MDDMYDLLSWCLIFLNFGVGCGFVVLIVLIVVNIIECIRKVFYNFMLIKVYKNCFEIKFMIKYVK